MNSELQEKNTLPKNRNENVRPQVHHFFTQVSRKLHTGLLECVLLIIVKEATLVKMRFLGVGMFFVLLFGLLALPPVSVAESLRLKGAGASFPFPLYGRWFKDYSKANSGVTVDYQAKGSGAGVK